MPIQYSYPPKPSGRLYFKKFGISVWFSIYILFYTFDFYLSKLSEELSRIGHHCRADLPGRANCIGLSRLHGSRNELLKLMGKDGT